MSASSGRRPYLSHRKGSSQSPPLPTLTACLRMVGGGHGWKMRVCYSGSLQPEQVHLATNAKELDAAALRMEMNHIALAHRSAAVSTACTLQPVPGMNRPLPAAEQGTGTVEAGLQAPAML